MNRKKIKFPKSKNLHESLELEHLWREVIFWGGGNSGGKIFQPTKCLDVL